MSAPRPSHLAAQPHQLPAVDTTQRFVRLIEERPDGLVAFEFAIGWPELAVELLLPAPAFAAFCAANRVQRLGA
jgi:phenol hydroxylase P0 protein